MKIAVIGGAGARTPLLVRTLAGSDLPIDEIALFDIDADRLRAIAGVAQAYSQAVRTCATAADCVRDADFVVLAIRVGGLEASARDEAIAVQHGVVGQETLGAAGFALAMRTIPQALGYARLVAREAPEAWILDLTRPVGIVTQAVAAQATPRIIGISEAPAELFADVAHAMRLDASRCDFDYFGLNHLGWLREVFFDGRPTLASIWGDSSLIKRVYRTPLFGAGFLKDLRLLPTEHLFYYYSPWEAFENARKAGQTREHALARLNAQLLETLARPGVDRVQAYESYLDARNAGYALIETGSARPYGSAATTGDDRIALAVVRAIHENANAIITLNVLNRGVLRDLADDDVVEVPCVVNANGARPLHVEAVPDSARELLVPVKEYERLTVEAAVLQSSDSAERALAVNPLIGHRDLARELIRALGPLW